MRLSRLIQKHERGFTLVEIMLALMLLILLLFAVYRLFFSEIRSIRHALEHIEVNESARLFLTQFGNDVRNANWLDSPTPVFREGVSRLLPALEGKVCGLTQQVFDFSVKPPDSRFIRNVKIEWRLKKGKDGTYELHRDVDSELPAYPGGPFPQKSTRMVCRGVKEIYVFSSIRKTPRYSSFPGLPFKNLLVSDPYDIDGTGPQLVHVRVTFIRPKDKQRNTEQENPLTIRTSFAIRGRLNGVNP